MNERRIKLVLVSLLAGLAPGCYGEIGPIKEIAECETRPLPVQPLRRLSSTQYRNVLVDLLGADLAVPLQAGTLFPPTTIKNGFTNDADQNTVNNRQSNAIEDEAERIAMVAIANPSPWLRTLMPCDVSATPITEAQIDGCIDDFIASFGKKAYRRPITDTEAAVAKQVFTAVRGTQPAVEAWASVLQYFLQAPALLYRVERGGDAAAARPGLVTLTPYEMASRLSFLFLDSGPDDELYRAAESGELSTRDQITDQARRLMGSSRFNEVLASFHADWLHLHEAGPKDATLYPGYTAAVQASLAREPGELVRYVLEQGDGSLRSLLDTPEIPVDVTLAAYYGVSAPTAAWSAVAQPGRRGILTLGSVQAALSNTLQSSPIHRGNFFRSSVLCEPQLVLPANVDISTPLQATSQLPTARERLAPLTVNSQCSGCHRQINPIGLAFETYDAGGRVRTHENGALIDASGEINLGTGPLPFTGPQELATILSSSEKVEQCYSLQWFRAATGRPETPEDACSIATLQTLVADSGGDLRELLIALTRTDAFLYRRSGE